MNLERTNVSKSQLDELGSRLRNSAEPSDEDLVLLDRYRERFITINDSVVETLRQLTGFAVESRHKSVPSIVAKLRRRQPARLSAIQDVAGARIIVPDLSAQDDLVAKIVTAYPNAAVDDKRAQPTFSYRAVHVVIRTPMPYEIQVRTHYQQTWAQLSERLADRYGFELKYGDGPRDVAEALAEYSDFLAAADKLVTHSFLEERPAGLIGAVRSQLEGLPVIMERLKIR